MNSILKKTLQDLEFITVLQQVSDHCITVLGKEQAMLIQPLADKAAITNVLGKTAEYLSSLISENRIPNHGFEAINRELQLLQIENTTEVISEIPKEIDKKIDKFGEVKDKASSALFTIREDMHRVRAKIGQSFAAALSTYQGSDYLDDIRESIVENRRVLAVKAMYRRKVKGTVVGNSKTGSIVYMEPEATLRHSRELSNLEFDETEEVQRILNDLTNFIRPYTNQLLTYQNFLISMDITAAKAKYAAKMQVRNEKTHPQTIELHPENRITVISGPNAGGKSITLKTVGLLQLMAQSGLLIPVHERSSICFFDKILTDIGDNQSIENHLSTYSYRLKNMKQFLKKCDGETLFLIDEFGTGSDPELGGALAEAFLEVFYERGAFGVITTHYANLKALADELPHTTNANMLFDGRTLQPTFQLVLGEAGSSQIAKRTQQNG